MHADEPYTLTKLRLAEAKQLFQSRHYVQCAILCEQMLTKSTTDQVRRRNTQS
jgi:hypothetical protein